MRWTLAVSGKQLLARRNALFDGAQKQGKRRR